MRGHRQSKRRRNSLNADRCEQLAKPAWCQLGPGLLAAPEATAVCGIPVAGSFAASLPPAVLKVLLVEQQPMLQQSNCSNARQL